MAMRRLRGAAIFGIVVVLASAGRAQQAAPAAYAALPAGCGYRPVLQRHACPGSGWLAPAYGTNGIHYQPVPPH